MKLMQREIRNEKKITNAENSIMELTSKRCLFLKNEVPGVVVPDTIIERMEKAKTKEDGIKYGVEIALDIKEQIKPYVNGYQVSAPFGKVDIGLNVLQN